MLNKGDPKWKWMPIRFKLFIFSIKLIAFSASPLSIANPNLLSKMPVVVYLWVLSSSSIAGDNLIKISWITPLFFDKEFNKSNSWKLSTTILLSPASCANLSSVSVLLFPWK